MLTICNSLQFAVALLLLWITSSNCQEGLEKRIHPLPSTSFWLPFPLDKHKLERYHYVD